ncbi:MAG: hypothetical protein IH851_05445 [Armatimonadetes bacterium]|nr:hypothetical protein [Armatimonadota bacterium]
MEIAPLTEALALVGTFVAASVWMMRYSMQQQRAIAERFIQHLESSLKRQEDYNRLHRSAVRQLTGAVRRNSQLIRRLVERRGDAKPRLGVAAASDDPRSPFSGEGAA